MANTATAVPAPPAYEPPTIDEEAEEAAAAAEAANIGGAVSDYAGPAGEPATEAERPLAEAGEGEAEGQEQAEVDLSEAAERDQRRGVARAAPIDDTIEQAANPLAGEQVEPAQAADDAEWRTWSGRSIDPYCATRPATHRCVAGDLAGGQPTASNVVNPRLARIGHNRSDLMSTLVGMQLSGRYRLDAQIGAGGMSTVYRAFDQTLERQVAIKLMHREIASDSDQLERFRREARAVAQLSHPHIVGVIDAGEDEGRPYIVFEYVEGETLKERIRRMGRLPVDEAVAYAIEIARALGCAHARDIVHRDVKPQNVLLDAEGSAKVTDFGIARSLDDEGLTADGRVLGTTDYVSPEQALGHEVNGQSDIYSLGVVLYEMLTGDVPFHGENQVSVAMKHVREDMPDLQSRRPEASATLASVLDRMTDKDLARRYPDIAALVADLEEALAIEAARSGKLDRRGDRVLRTLPARARRRLPFRMRHPLPVLG